MTTHSKVSITFDEETSIFLLSKYKNKKQIEKFVHNTLLSKLNFKLNCPVCKAGQFFFIPKTMYKSQCSNRKCHAIGLIIPDYIQLKTNPHIRIITKNGFRIAVSRTGTGRYNLNKFITRYNQHHS